MQANQLVLSGCTYFPPPLQLKAYIRMDITDKNGRVMKNLFATKFPEEWKLTRDGDN